MVSLSGLEGSIVPYSFLGIQESYKDSSYVIVGVPYDATSSWMPGSRAGPLAIIEASRYMDPYDMELGCIPAEAGLHTIPELSVLESTPESMVSTVRLAVDKVIDDGKVPILLGGEHTLSLGAVQGVKERIEVYMTLDAHADFYDEYEGRRISHATVSKRISELVEEVIIYGVRTLGWEEREELDSLDNVTLIPLLARDGEAMDALLRGIEGKNVYLSVDVDVLDPSALPCLGTPEPGGMSYRDVVMVLRKVFRRAKVVAMDFVEFSPCPGMRSDAYTVARLVYKSIGYHVLYSGKQDLRCGADE
ncbi:MAG: agmatinase [Candidatus Korarchaeota archaeon]|nr:agmatinase [Candidatus Korarchaeota archaeon]